MNTVEQLWNDKSFLKKRLKEQEAYIEEVDSKRFWDKEAGRPDDIGRYDDLIESAQYQARRYELAIQTLEKGARVMVTDLTKPIRYDFVVHGKDGNVLVSKKEGEEIVFHVPSSDAVQFLVEQNHQAITEYGKVKDAIIKMADNWSKVSSVPYYLQQEIRQLKAMVNS